MSHFDWHFPPSQGSRTLQSFPATLILSRGRSSVDTMLGNTAIRHGVRAVVRKLVDLIPPNLEFLEHVGSAILSGQF